MKLQLLSVVALCAVCAGAKEPELAIPKWGSAKPAEFRPAAARPADFDAYWEGEAARFEREVPLRPLAKLRADITNAVADVYEVSFALTADGASRLYGWLAIPKNVPAGRRLPLCVEVPGAGYGFWTIDPNVAKDEIHLKLTVYDFCPVPYTGFRHKADYEAFQRPWTNRYHATTYATSGWGASREETFFHDRWLTMSRAVDWAMATYGARIDPTRVSYTGESQGGGTGFFLLAMNRHFTHGVLRVPAVTDVLGRLAGRKSGWPYPVESQSTDAARAKALEVAPYFDGACFAPRITVPVRCCLGTADVTCPWPNVSAAFNCIACRDKELLIGLNDNHTSNGCGQRQKMEAWRKGRTAHGDHAVGRIADAEAFVGLHPRFRKAFDFLRRKDLASLAVGDYVLEKAADGTPSVKAMVQELDLKPYGATTQLVEAHRRFIDIQMPLSESETFGFATLDDTLPTWTFDAEKDYGLQQQRCRKVTLRPNEFAIFFPPYGAHAPCLSDNGPRKVRKVVIKVLAEEP